MACWLVGWLLCEHGIELVLVGMSANSEEFGVWFLRRTDMSLCEHHFLIGAVKIPG